MPRYQRTRDEARILVALNQMPYGTMSTVSRAAKDVGRDEHDQPGPVDLGKMADYLEALRAVLVESTTEAAQTANELRDLKADVAAMRRVLGTASRVP